MIFCESDSAADNSSPHKMPALFCSSSVFPFESGLIGKHQVEELIFLVTVFQDPAWPRSIPRTEAVEQRNFHRLSSSMNITALATSHAIARICTNQNETTHNRRAEQCMQGTASDSTFGTSADTRGSGQPPAPAVTLPQNMCSSRKTSPLLFIQATNQTAALPRRWQRKAGDTVVHLVPSQEATLSDRIHTPQPLLCLTIPQVADYEAWNLNSSKFL